MIFRKSLYRIIKKSTKNSAEAGHLIFWILGNLLYLSRIVVQPDLKSSSRADTQGGRNCPPGSDKKNSPDLIGLKEEKISKDISWLWNLL